MQHRNVSQSSVRVELLEFRRLLSAAVPTISQTNLVSDLPGTASHTDTNLKNAWGLAFNPAGPIWVANNATGTSTIYDASGSTILSPVSIPGPGGNGSGAPTGLVFHKGRGFNVSSGGADAPSTFIFSTEDGTIAAWSAAENSPDAPIVVDHSGAGDVFKGLAIAGNKLFATDFHHGAIEIFDQNFNPVPLKGGAFSDTSIPAGFAPFAIHAVGSKLYVTYALRDASGTSDVKGAGNGFVDVFSTSGKLIRRLASGGNLNSPWGVAIAPSKWGALKGDVLVGNFGDGRINVFNGRGQSVGQLADSTGTPVTIDGLWALTPGVGANKNNLFFTAGPNDESDGLFGMLNATVAKATRSTASGGGTGGYVTSAPPSGGTTTPGAGATTGATTGTTSTGGTTTGMGGAGAGTGTTTGAGTSTGIGNPMLPPVTGGGLMY